MSRMFRAGMSCRYSITLYQWVTETSRWDLGNIHAYTLLVEPPAAQAGTGHLPRSIFLTEFYLPNLHYQDCRIIFIDKLRVFMFHFRS